MKQKHVSLTKDISGRCYVNTISRPQNNIIILFCYFGIQLEFRHFLYFNFAATTVKYFRRCISVIPNYDTLLLLLLLQLLQGYFVTLVAGIYWNQYLSSLLLSCGRAVSSLLRRAPSAASEEAREVSVWRLASYMRPYSGRFVVVVVLVVLSSYGETLDGLSGRRVGRLARRRG